MMSQSTIVLIVLFVAAFILAFFTVTYKFSHWLEKRDQRPSKFKRTDLEFNLDELPSFPTIPGPAYVRDSPRSRYAPPAAAAATLKAAAAKSTKVSENPYNVQSVHGQIQHASIATTTVSFSGTPRGLSYSHPFARQSESGFVDTIIFGGNGDGNKVRPALEVTDKQPSYEMRNTFCRGNFAQATAAINLLPQTTYVSKCPPRKPVPPPANPTYVGKESYVPLPMKSVPVPGSVVGLGAPEQAHVVGPKVKFEGIAAIIDYNKLPKERSWESQCFIEDERWTAYRALHGLERIQ